MTQPRFQYTLSHGLITVTVVSAFFGSMVWAGPLGAIAFGGVVGIALVCLAIVRRDSRFVLAGVALTLLAAVLLVEVGSVALGYGSSTLQCSARVVDESGNPVDSATVRFREVSELDFVEDGVPVQPIPSGEPGASGKTNVDGRVTLQWTFESSSRTGAFVDESHVYKNPCCWLQIDAAGYETELLSFQSVMGRSYDWDDLPLPQVEVRLKRTVAD